MPVSLLEEPDVRKIKERLWNGDTCDVVARDYDISTSAVRSIRAGVRWAAVPWPAIDGEKELRSGGMPNDRGRQILVVRREAARDAAKVVRRKLKQQA